jgi:hypothetical protein
VAYRGTHHDAGGRAGHTGVSGGADAPGGGKRLLGRARRLRWACAWVRGRGWGRGWTQVCPRPPGPRRTAWRRPPGGTVDSRAGPGWQRPHPVPAPCPGAARAPSAAAPCGSRSLAGRCARGGDRRQARPGSRGEGVPPRGRVFIPRASPGCCAPGGSRRRGGAPIERVVRLRGPRGAGRRLAIRSAPEPACVRACCQEAAMPTRCTCF